MKAIEKTGGCALRGKPDKKDAIQDCAAQAQVYPLLIEAQVLLAALL